MGRLYLIAIGVVVVAALLLWLRRRKKRAEKTFTGNVNANAAATPAENSQAAFTTDTNSFNAEVRKLMAAGEKIEAIKLVRQRTGLGLKEAKDYVERL